MSGTLRRSAGYAVAGLALVLVVVGALWLPLTPEHRGGLVFAGAVAWVVQAAAYGLLEWSRDRRSAFLLVWGGGMLVRGAAVLAVAGAIVFGAALPPLSTLLGLAGFFFLLLLLEPVFFKAGVGTNQVIGD